MEQSIRRPEGTNPFSVNISSAVAHIHAVQNNIRGKYGNYSSDELGSLLALIPKMEKGEITPMEAMAMADGIFESKNFR